VFLPEVMPWVPNCPDLVAKAAVRNALIEFCNQSQWWVLDHAALTVVAGQGNYELDPPTDADIVTLANVRVGGRTLEAKSMDQLDQLFPSDSWRTLSGAPRYFTRIEPAEIQLVPTPDETLAQGLTIEAVMRPARGAEFVSEEFYRRWAEQIGYGARARLHEMSGQPFYDMSAAAVCAARFRAAIGEARVERMTSQTRAEQRLRFPRIV
jgi:hypothetical protein